MAYKYKRLMNFFKNKGDRGSYLSGSPQEGFTIKKGAKLYIFPNEYKKTDNQPDFSLCIREGEK